jgi:hypothetical protein
MADQVADKASRPVTASFQGNADAGSTAWAKFTTAELIVFWIGITGPCLKATLLWITVSALIVIRIFIGVIAALGVMSSAFMRGFRAGGAKSRRRSR